MPFTYDERTKLYDKYYKYNNVLCQGKGEVILANRRKLKLKDYGISEKRYKELCGFCEQYPEWKDELKYKKDTLKSKQITDMPLSTEVSNATESLIVKREYLRKKCELIEQTAKEADAELSQYIIKSVCYNEPYWYLRDIMGIPCNQTDFYAARKNFFYILNKNKK